MSASQYQQFGGNPFGQGPTDSREFQAPYGSAPVQDRRAPAPLTHELSTYSQASNYSQPMPATSASPAPPPGTYTAPAAGPLLSQADFLAQINAIRTNTSTLTSHISEIATLHQRALSSTDSSSSAELEQRVTQTQVLNTQITESIKKLEVDVLRTTDQGQARTKRIQVDSLKRGFRRELESYQQEEAQYRQRYREQIARQYRIVNPEANDTEVQEAANADWGNEGVFQTALRTNRTGAATSVLSAVRARHTEIQRIEATITELATLFNQLDEIIQLQEVPVANVEGGAENANENLDKGGGQLDQAIRIRRRTRRLQWYTLLVFVLIACILALILGLYFGLRNRNNNKNTKPAAPATTTS